MFVGNQGVAVHRSRSIGCISFGPHQVPRSRLQKIPVTLTRAQRVNQDRQEILQKFALEVFEEVEEENDNLYKDLLGRIEDK